MIKSTGAILAGILAQVILSYGTDTILEKLGILDSSKWMIPTALAYRLVYTYIGGLVTAILAPNRPMKHVIILGCIGTALCIWVGEFGFISITQIVMYFPITWWGGVRGAIKMQRQ